jgi:hypothetical protein
MLLRDVKCLRHEKSGTFFQRNRSHRDLFHFIFRRAEYFIMAISHYFMPPQAVFHSFSSVSGLIKYPENVKYGRPYLPLPVWRRSLPRMKLRGAFLLKITLAFDLGVW